MTLRSLQKEILAILATSERPDVQKVLLSGATASKEKVIMKPYKIGKPKTFYAIFNGVGFWNTNRKFMEQDPLNATLYKSKSSARSALKRSGDTS